MVVFCVVGDWGTVKQWPAHAALHADLRFGLTVSQEVLRSQWHLPLPGRGLCRHRIRHRERRWGAWWVYDRNDQLLRVVFFCLNNPHVFVRNCLLWLKSELLLLLARQKNCFLWIGSKVSEFTIKMLATNLVWGVITSHWQACYMKNLVALRVHYIRLYNSALSSIL